MTEYVTSILSYSVFYQLQQVFGQLLESKLQSYEPEKFWKVFRLWGQVVNIREQQDAFDFFTALIDQGDEYTKVVLIQSKARIFPCCIHTKKKIPKCI